MKRPGRHSSRSMCLWKASTAIDAARKSFRSSALNLSSSFVETGAAKWSSRFLVASAAAGKAVVEVLGRGGDKTSISSAIGEGTLATQLFASNVASELRESSS